MHSSQQIADTRAEPPVVFITGSSRGFGLCLARLLLERGCTVGLNGSSSVAPSVAEGLDGTRSAYFQADVADHSSIVSTFAAFEEQFSGIEVLINNAAASMTPTPFSRWSQEQIERMVTSTLLGTAFCTQFAIASQRARNASGRVINISSVAAAVTSPGLSVYSACKVAIEQLTQCIADEVRKRRIVVEALRLPPLSGMGMTTQFSPLQQHRMMEKMGDLQIPAMKAGDMLADMIAERRPFPGTINLLSSKGVSRVD